MSCGEDPEPEVPPTAVSNIQVNVIGGTRIEITWNASSDLNRDVIFYEVVLNGKVVTGKKHFETKLIYDVMSFLPKIKGQELQRGIDFKLKIAIRAVDSKGFHSKKLELIKNVPLNRIPEAFSIENVIFHDAYQGVDVIWTPTYDLDGDQVSYDVFLNQELMFENYVIAPDSKDGLGIVHFDTNYFKKTMEDIMVKVVAKDAFGGVREVQKTFKLRGSDIDLGEVAVFPYNKIENYKIADTDVDGTIGFTFKLTVAAGLVLRHANNENIIQVRDINGGKIDFTSQIRYNSENIYKIKNLKAGEYYVEVKVVDTLSGELSFDILKNDETDKDLGTLLLPYTSTLEVSMSEIDLDDKVVYSFSVEKPIKLGAIRGSGAGRFELKNAKGTVIGEGGENGHGYFLIVSNLPAGEYYFEFDVGINELSTFRILIREN